MTNVRRKGKWKRMALDFSLRNTGEKYVLSPTDSANCDCREGGLRAGFQGKKFLTENGSLHTCPIENVEKVLILKKYNEGNKSYEQRLGVLTQAGAFFIQEEDGSYLEIASGLQGAGVECFVGVDNKQWTALLGSDRCVFFKDDGSFEVAMLPNSTKKGCFFQHRFFIGVRPAGLACSAPENPIDFEESIHDGGLIRFPNVGGEIVAVKPYMGALYVFFDYGVLLVRTSGAPKNFTAEKLAYVGGKIHGETVCVGNRGIYFLSDEGVYQVCGERITKMEIFNFLPPREEKMESSGVIAERILMRYTTKTGEKTLVFYEDGRDAYYTSGIPAFTMSEGGRCAFVGNDKLVYVLSDEGEWGGENYFNGAETDFGVMGRKTLTELHFEGEGEFSFTVKTCGRRFSRTVKFENGRAVVRLSERGDWFSFDFSLSPNACIRRVTATLKITI